MKKKLIICAIVVTLLLVLTGCDQYYPGYSVIQGSPSGNQANVHEQSLMVNDYFTAIAEGDVPGHSVQLLLGYNGSVGSSQEDIWYGSTTYVFPTVAQQMEVVSTSAEDDPDTGGGVPGTGIWEVDISYLDGTYALHNTTVILNGTVPVSTSVSNIFRVNDMRLRNGQVGTLHAAAGDIVIRNLAGTPAYSYIETGYTKNRNCVFTVPLGYAFYCRQWDVGVAGLLAANNARLTLRSTWDIENQMYLVPGLVFMPLDEILMPNGNVQREHTLPVRFPEKTDIKVSGVVDNGNARVSSGLRGWIEPMTPQ